MAGIFLAAGHLAVLLWGVGGRKEQKRPLWTSRALPNVPPCNVLFLGKQSRCQSGTPQGLWWARPRGGPQVPIPCTLRAHQPPSHEAAL